MREFAAATGQLWKFHVSRVLSFGEIIAAVVMLVFLYRNPAGLEWVLGFSVFAGPSWRRLFRGRQLFDALDAKRDPSGIR